MNYNVEIERDNGYFRGGGFSSRFLTEAEMPATMIRLNLVKGLDPVLQIAEGWTIKLPFGVSDVLLEVMPGDDVETPIWEAYKEIVAKYDERVEKAVGNIKRFVFYEEAKTAYAIIATSESALYANVMLQKGMVVE